MAKQLGPTFGNEVIAAGLGEFIGWGPTDDTIAGREKLTAAQSAALDGVIAAHDPTAALPPPPPATEDIVLYDHENRLRGLEGLPPLTLKDFIRMKSNAR